MELVREVFIEEDVESILSIPTSTTKNWDRKIWHPSPNGKFTVKSAYHLEKDQGFRGMYRVLRLVLQIC